MAKFIKSALKVGETFIDGTGKPVPITAKRLSHFSKQFARLTANKYNVPIDWDHGDTLEAISPVLMSEQKKRRSAKNTVGELAGFSLAPDGKSAELTLKVSDPVAEGRAERNEVYISPVIMDKWRDGHGHEYKDVITHVDFVNHPVDHSQGPFKKVPAVEAGTVAMAIRMGLSAPCTFMGFPDDEDEDDQDDATDTDTDDDDDEIPDVDDETPEGATMDTERVHRVIEALKTHDLVLPEDTDGSNILERLEVALGVKAAIEGKGDPDTNAGAGGDPQIKVTDPGGGFQGMSLDPRTKAAIQYAERQHRESIATRLAALLKNGQCTPAEFQPREPQIRVIKLSLGADDKPELSDLEKWIESREAVPAGTFWDAKTRTQKLSLVEPPASQRGESTPEEAKAIADWALGGKYPG